MSQAERRPGLFEMAIKKIASLTKGYSPEDLANTRRFAAGNILPEDRIVFKTGEISRLTQMATAFRPIGLNELGSIPSAFPSDLLGALQEIETLPDYEIDKRLTFKAKRDLELWKQPA